MGNTGNCIYRADCPRFGTDRCVSICPYYIITHGETGNGGYWATRNVPSKYASLTADDLPKGKSFDTIRRYVDKLPKVVEEGTGLYLFSMPSNDNPFGTGVGKTLSATVILNEFTKIQSKRITRKEVDVHYNPSLFVKSSDFQNKYNSQFRGSKAMQEQASIDYYNYKLLMKNVQLLVIDDIATRTGTEAFINEMYEIIDHRATEDCATIFTSNIPLIKLDQFLDERIVSRIDGMAVQVPFAGVDNRKKSF